MARSLLELGIRIGSAIGLGATLYGCRPPEPTQIPALAAATERAIARQSAPVVPAKTETPQPTLDYMLTPDAFSSQIAGYTAEAPHIIDTIPARGSLDNRFTIVHVNISDYPITLNVDSIKQLQHMFEAVPAKITYVYTYGEPGSLSIGNDGELVVRFANERDLNVFGLAAFNAVDYAGTIDLSAGKADALYQVAQLAGWTSDEYLAYVDQYSVAIRGQSENFSGDRVLVSLVGFPFSCFPDDGSLVRSGELHMQAAQQP